MEGTLFKKIMMAGLAVGALALGAPAAHADDPTFDCNFNSVQQEASTGQAHEGAAYGFVVHAGDTSATIRCYIAVNGGEASSTPTSVGVTAGRLTYSAGDTDVVTFHAEVCTSHGCFIHDYETVRQDVPPQEVWDLLFSLAETLDATLAPVYAAIDGVITLLNDTVFSQIDPTICPVIGSLAPGAGPVVITSAGDISVDGIGVWDCPPYGV